VTLQSSCQHQRQVDRGRRLVDGDQLTLVVPVVFLILPVTVLFALFPGLISIVSLAQ
jgi:tight adherence protein C